MTLVLLLILLALGVAVAVSRNLLAGILFLSGFSLVSALLFYILRAPDVAITEAAVGAGVSTLIFLWTVKDTDGGDA